MKDKSNYLEQDPIWEKLGIENQKQYLDEIYVKGRFHENVPSVIKDDFEIVECLMFYSYFNYGLIDEAYGKATRIFESSVEVRMEELELEKSPRFENLKTKLDRIQEYTTQNLLHQYQALRGLRNTFAHHKSGRLMGITIVDIIVHVINMINSLFLSKNQLVAQDTLLKELISTSNHLRDGVFVLENSRNRFLVYSSVPYACWKNNGEKVKSFWMFHPVIDAQEITENNVFLKPFCYHLKDIKFSKAGMKGVEIKSQEIIKVSKTIHEKDIGKYKNHCQLMKNTSPELKGIKTTLLNRTINISASKFLYEVAW
ncbi:MAG TPA: hypothetical protein VJ917_08135 [Saprospiraceae bacterium]|nr:hypothetical protein [Saprospiraceae bacterium]